MNMTEWRSIPPNYNTVDSRGGHDANIKYQTMWKFSVQLWGCWRHVIIDFAVNQAAPSKYHNNNISFSLHNKLLHL